MSVGYCSDEFLWHQQNTNTSSKSQRDVSLLKKKFSFKEGAERDDTDATDLYVLIANFLLQVREFLFLIYFRKTVSIKILVLRVINSSRHRNCFVRGYVVCMKSPHSLVPRSFGLPHKQLVNITPVRIYIYIYISLFGIKKLCFMSKLSALPG